MQIASVKTSKKSSRFADAIRTVREFHMQYPRDRKAPKLMQVRISSWELLAGPKRERRASETINASSEDDERQCFYHHGANKS